MVRKKGQAAVAEKESLITCSSALLDHHLGDLLEAVEEIHNLVGALRMTGSEDKKRDAYEGRLYAALAHLEYHLKPAIKEWDRVVDRMPDD